MSSIVKTRIQGFRSCIFKNHEVHKYYGHLQSVMRSLDGSGKYNELFAKPEVDTLEVGATEIEWTCSSNSKARHFSQLSESEQQNAESYIASAFAKIENYIAENSKSTDKKSKDYAHFLSIIGKKPDNNQIWLINNKPTIVQWGFVDDNGLIGSSGIYSDWESFVKDVKRVEPVKADEPIKIIENVSETKEEAVPLVPMASSELFEEKEPEKPIEDESNQPAAEDTQKPVEKPVEENTPDTKKPDDEKDTEEPKTQMAGLGKYEWVKWLAIILAIIILLLLLLRFLPNLNNHSNYPNG